MKYEASLLPDLPESRTFSQQPGSKCSAFPKNSSLTQVNRCPRYVQVPFKYKLSWLPLKKMNSYKRIAVSTTMQAISQIINLDYSNQAAGLTEGKILDSSSQVPFCLQRWPAVSEMMNSLPVPTVCTGYSVLNCRTSRASYRAELSWTARSYFLFL